MFYFYVLESLPRNLYQMQFLRVSFKPETQDSISNSTAHARLSKTQTAPD